MPTSKLTSNHFAKHMGISSSNTKVATSLVVVAAVRM